MAEFQNWNIHFLHNNDPYLINNEILTSKFYDVPVNEIQF